MKLSVCIPTWHRNKRGPSFLKDCFASIGRQDISKDSFQVCVADQSPSGDDRVLRACLDFSDHSGIDVVHRRFPLSDSPSRNYNNAIELADCDVCKLMSDDNLLIETDVLSTNASLFEQGGLAWLVEGCICHFFTERPDFFIQPLYTQWNPDIWRGNNTLSEPSVVTFRKSTGVRFDPRLSMLLDVDFYQSLFLNSGMPYFKYVNDYQPTIAIRKATNDSFSYHLGFKNSDGELDIVESKYGSVREQENK